MHGPRRLVRSPPLETTLGRRRAYRPRRRQAAVLLPPPPRPRPRLAGPPPPQRVHHLPPADVRRAQPTPSRLQPAPVIPARSVPPTARPRGSRLRRTARGARAGPGPTSISSSNTFTILPPSTADWAHEPRGPDLRPARAGRRDPRAAVHGRDDRLRRGRAGAGRHHPRAPPGGAADQQGGALRPRVQRLLLQQGV